MDSCLDHASRQTACAQVARENIEQTNPCKRIPDVEEEVSTPQHSYLHRPDENVISIKSRSKGHRCYFNKQITVFYANVHPLTMYTWTASCIGSTKLMFKKSLANVR